MEKLFLGHFARFGVMCDEDDFDVLITGAKKLIQEEEETARQVFLHRVHRPRGIHDAQHNRVGFVARIRHGVMIAKIVFVKRKALMCCGIGMLSE